MSTQPFFFSPDPVVRWIHTRLDTTTNSDDHLLSEEIWKMALSEMGLPDDAKKIEGRSRKEFIHLMRVTLGLKKQKVKRVGRSTRGYYEYLKWADEIPDSQKIEVILD